MNFHWPWNNYLLQVANYTYTCYFPGQELSIRIISNGWLHKGALVCPPCEELCQVKGKTSGNASFAVATIPVTKIWMLLYLFKKIYYK
jgi:hypothetical protein